MKRVKPAVKYTAVMGIVILLVVGLYLYLVESKKSKTVEKEGPPKSEATVKASSEYLKLYGNVPDVGMIKCEAFVAYYPSIDGKEYLPFPFFITSPEKRDTLVARTLLAGLPTKALSKVASPLLSGKWELVSVDRKERTLTFLVKGNAEKSSQGLEKAAGALFLTYSQFYPDLAEVRLKVEGGNEAVSRGEGLKVRDPGAPALLDAFLVKKGEDEKPGELRVIFDRPVMILDFEVKRPGGEKVPGKVYLAEFSMAAILDLDEGGSVREGENLVISYGIHDYLGRVSRGEKSFPMRVEVHSK